MNERTRRGAERGGGGEWCRLSFSHFTTPKRKIRSSFFFPLSEFLYGGCCCSMQYMIFNRACSRVGCCVCVCAMGQPTRGKRGGAYSCVGRLLSVVTAPPKRAAGSSAAESRRTLAAEHETRGCPRCLAYLARSGHGGAMGGSADGFVATVTKLMKKSPLGRLGAGIVHPAPHGHARPGRRRRGRFS